MPTSGPASMSARAPVLVLGLGNPLLRDDGVGIELLNQLAKVQGRWNESTVVAENLDAALGKAQNVVDAMLADLRERKREGDPYVSGGPGAD